MKPASVHPPQSNRRLILIMTGATLLLMLPLIGMAFSTEVNWDAFDFLVAGVLLYGAGLILELLLRKLRTTRARVIGALILFIVLALIWVEMAVGLFGSPIAGS